MYKSPKEETEKYILDFISKSFNEKSFFSPAIPAKDSFTYPYIDQKVFDELKSNKETIGFSFSTGYEDTRRIAYLKSIKRVVKYLECC